MSTLKTQPVDIAFIACNKNPAKFRQDASFFYRCENPAVTLQQASYSAALQHCEDNTALALTPRVAIFHRPAFRNWRQARRLKRLVKRYRQLGATVIADFDDLVFAPSFAEFSPGVINQLVSLRQTQALFRQHYRALSIFQHFQVSTTPLKQHLAQFDIPQSAIDVVHNAVPVSWMSLQPRPLPQTTKFEIKYFPGTRSHDQDFADIIEPIRAFLADHSDARLQVTGVLDAEQVRAQLGRQQQQFDYSAKVPLSDYVRTLNSGHIHLAPLQDTAFNQCKSALKAIEANFFNRHVIASPIADMERLPKQGITLAQSSEQWYDTLAECYLRFQKDIKPPPLRASLLQTNAPEQQVALLLQRLAPSC